MTRQVASSSGQDCAAHTVRWEKFEKFKKFKKKFCAASCAASFLPRIRSKLLLKHSLKRSLQEEVINRRAFRCTSPQKKRPHRLHFSRRQSILQTDFGSEVE